jgi:hypothetical protein
MAYELTVEAMDLMFWEKFNDPYYNVTADDWYPMIIDDQDDELDWTDYKMNWDYYDPLQKKVGVKWVGHGLLDSWPETGHGMG